MTKRKNKSEEMPMTKKEKLELRPEDFAKPIGKIINSTSLEDNKKFHYESFTFHGKQYELEDSMLFNPEQPNKEKPYVGIIKDIYVQEKEGYVKLGVQWLYRPEDIEIKDVGMLKCKDARDLFYSFHQDEVFAETVMHKCIVHFVPENKQIPKRKDHPGFIVQKVYGYDNNKVMQFNYNWFEVNQKDEIDLLVAKTISRIGHLPDLLKKQKSSNSKA